MFDSKIYFIELKYIIFANISKKLNSYGYIEGYISDFNFCPYLIIYKHKDPKTREISFIFENINSGYLKALMSTQTVIEDDNEHDFLEHAKDIRINRENNNINSLF